MLRLIVPLLLLLLLTTPSAHGVVKGSASAHGRFTVRLLGGGRYCSGVVIARNAVATAGHCARGMRVIAAGRSFGIAGISLSTVLDDGRRATVSGDAAILRLAAPLPAEFDVAPIGDGSGDSYTIAGYGTTTSAGATRSGRCMRPPWLPMAPASSSTQTVPAPSGRAPVSAIPAGPCCVAACWSVSSPALRIPHRVLPAGI
jgi:hypothetical protein